MNISKNTLVSTLTLTAVLSVGGLQRLQPTQAAELVTNGGFESGSTGWTTGGSTNFIGSWGFQHTGSQSWQVAAVNPNRGTLSQVISGLTAGQTATVSFWVGNQDGDTPSGLDVSIGALSLFNLSNEPAASSAPGTFVQYTKSFVSPSANPTLFFSGFNNPGALFVDDVSIITQDAPKSTPEPGSILGLLVVGGGLLAFKRHKV